MWQGVHISIIRELTQCLTVSAYHGSQVTKVIQHSDLAQCAREDVRPLIGKALAGGEVWYPTENPSPSQWNHRRVANGGEAWIARAREIGINADWISK